MNSTSQHLIARYEIASAEGASVTETTTATETHASTEKVFFPPTINSETIAHVGSFEIRNTLIMSWLTVLVLVIVAWRTRKTKYEMVPGKFQNFMETIIEGIFDFFQSVTQNRKETKLFFGVCATIFLYIISSNWLGLLPGVGSIGIFEQHNGHEVLVPLLRSSYSDINMTLAIALISVVVTQFFGIMQLGAFHYLGKFFVNPFRDPIGCFVGLLEFVSEFAKIISFSFRLYGNIFAGDVLLAVMAFLLPFIAPIPFYGLELFVGLIQALVFCLLTLVFMKMAATPHGEHEEHATTGA
ncbi:MAG: F0F1 ATP synthase subunit A [Patescibacteria group bacterium]